MAPFTAQFLLLAAFIGITTAHFNLKSPMPYNPIDCNKPDCQGPCPPIWKSGNAKARNGPSNPSAVWSRGQKVTIEWHKNNHEGGYYRRALVPVKHMFNNAWHKKTAFEWGCWSQNEFLCGKKKECGTDVKGRAYRNTMTVPKTFPDGDYVFAMLWFGGIHWRRNKALFSDYHTCAYVAIRGGPVADKHTPTFVRGSNPKDVKPGTCASTSSYVGECGGRPCHKNPVREDVPGVFRNGKVPPAVLLNNLDKDAMATVPDDKLPVEPQSEEKKAMAESKMEEKMDNKWAKEEQNSSAGKNSNNNKNKSNNNKSSNSNDSKSNSNKNQGKCTGMHNGPQRPTGSWGKRNSRVYRNKLRQFRAWRKFCKSKKFCSCWN